MRKSPDGYTVLGPCLTTAYEVADVNNLDMLIKVNDEIRQSANTCELIMDVAAPTEFASACYTEHPGDILMTVTPEGVSQVFPGDRMCAESPGWAAWRWISTRPDLHAL